MTKRVCEDPVPSLDGGQLLRGDARQNVGRPLRIGVGAGNAQRRLARMTQALSDTGQEQRPAGDRLKMPSGLGEPDEQVPPVVDEGDETGRKPATGRDHAS
jgi:hypothetical protein